MRDGREFLLRVAAGLVVAAIVAAIKWGANQYVPWLACVLGLIVGTFLTTFWHRRTTVPFSARLEGSQFVLLNIAKRAKKSIFVIGPNLNYIATNPEAKQLLFEKLAMEGFRVWLLVSDPAAAVAKVWESVGYDPGFEADLRRAMVTFGAWLNPTERPNLRVKTTGVVTLSLMFIDAEDDANACVLVIPVPRNVSGNARPCFLITRRQHQLAFSTYYDAYRGLFDSPLAQDIQASKVRS